MCIVREASTKKEKRYCLRVKRRRKVVRRNDYSTVRGWEGRDTYKELGNL